MNIQLKINTKTAGHQAEVVHWFDMGNSIQAPGA